VNGLVWMAPLAKKSTVPLAPGWFRSPTFTSAC
jgi:hypothetical protein